VSQRNVENQENQRNARRKKKKNVKKELKPKQKLEHLSLKASPSVVVPVVTLSETNHPSGANHNVNNIDSHSSNNADTNHSNRDVDTNKGLSSAINNQDSVEMEMVNATTLLRMGADGDTYKFC